MLETLSGQDSALDFIDITKQDIVESITLQDVKTFLESLGVDQIALYEDKGYLICPTICHNPLHEAQSMKLYWYQNNKIFRCYTECNEAMSIFKLYQKFMELNERPVTDEEAEDYVKKCLRHIVIASSRNTDTYDFEKEKYSYSANIPILDAYPAEILTYFTKYYHPSWLKDGITKEAILQKKLWINFKLNFL